jgi:hypothetical protein
MIYMTQQKTSSRNDPARALSMPFSYLVNPVNPV